MSLDANLPEPSDALRSPVFPTQAWHAPRLMCALQATMKAKEHFQKRGDKTQAENKARETSMKNQSREGAEKNVQRHSQAMQNARKQAEGRNAARAKESNEKAQADAERQREEARRAAEAKPPALDESEMKDREKKRRCVVEENHCIDVNPQQEPPSFSSSSPQPLPQSPHLPLLNPLILPVTLT